MTIYGTPDFWRPPSPAGQLIVGSKGYAAASMTFPMQDVSDYGVIAIRLRPTGTITGYALIVNFYIDAAATQLCETYTWHSFNGALVLDQIVPPTPHCNITFAPGATGGGQTFDFYMIGLAGSMPNQKADGVGTLVNYMTTISAGGTVFLYASAVHAGAVSYAFDIDAASWYTEVGCFTFNAGPVSSVLTASNVTHQPRFQSSLLLPRQTARVMVTNNDGVARNLRAHLLAA